MIALLLPTTEGQGQGDHSHLGLDLDETSQTQHVPIAEEELTATATLAEVADSLFLFLDDLQVTYDVLCQVCAMIGCGWIDEEPDYTNASIPYYSSAFVAHSLKHTLIEGMRYDPAVGPSHESDPTMRHEERHFPLVENGTYLFEDYLYRHVRQGDRPDDGSESGRRLSFILTCLKAYQSTMRQRREAA